jgi:hypothetical protein
LLSLSICSAVSSTPSAATFSSTRATRLVPDRGDVVALGQQPGQGDLCRGGAGLGGDGLDLVGDAQVALERTFRRRPPRQLFT